MAASLSAGASSAGVSGWRALPNAPVASSRTDDIWFADEDTGWCVNSNGEVWRTDDGGDNWTLQLTVPQDHPAKPYLRTIHFAPENPDVGWFGVLCGAQDSYLDILVHHTTDGGQTWTPVTNLPQGVPQGICGISVVNAEVMYGSGSNEPGANVIGPGIIKTVDGGQTWTLIDMSKHATNLIDIWFEDEQHGYVVGGRTDDWCPGNQPWYRNYRDYAKLIPVVLETKDGGQTWTNLIGAQGLVNSFDCGSWGWKLFWLSDRQRGFVAIEDFRQGAILATEDAGKNWLMRRVNDSRLVVVGKDGKDSKDEKDPKAPKDPKNPKGPKSSKIEISNANLEGIGFIDKNRGWVGGWGDENFIGNYNSYTKNAGRDWVAQDHDPDDPNSDPRVNVNRYRFVGNYGYCSGKTIYKLNLGGGKTDGKLNKVDKTEGKSAKSMKAVSKAGRAVALAGLTPSKLGFAVRPGDARGEASINLDIPAGTKKVTIGVWSHFGWFVDTLLAEDNPTPGPRTLSWDGSARAGTRLIFRVTADEERASETFLLR